MDYYFYHIFDICMYHHFWNQTIFGYFRLLNLPQNQIEKSWSAFVSLEIEIAGMFQRARNTGYQWVQVCKKLSKNAKCTQRCDMKKTKCRILRDDLRHSWSSYSRRRYDFPRLRRRKIKPRIRVSVRPSVRVSHVAAYMQWNAVISRLSRLESATIERRNVG